MTSIQHKTIPQIIHHIAPADSHIWHPLWHKCMESWQKHFDNFQIIVWNDSEDIDCFVRDNYPKYWNLYCDFPLHIMKIDFVRYCLLHSYGGIYADMDVFCYKNFYNELESCAYILQAPYGQPNINGKNFIENCLMISCQGDEFFEYCMQSSYDRFYSYNKRYRDFLKFPLTRFAQTLVGNITGPVLVSDCYDFFSNEVKILNGLIYNNHGMSYHKEYRTKHLLTGMWGKEAFAQIQEKSTDKMNTLGNIYMQEVQKYVAMNNVTVDSFDFYHDYTNGGMKSTFTYYNDDLQLKSGYINYD